MLVHVGGHLNSCGDRGVSTDLLPDAFTCIPHTWKTKANPRTTLGVWFFFLVSSVSPSPPSMEKSSPFLLSWVHFFFLEATFFLCRFGC